MSRRFRPSRRPTALVALVLAIWIAVRLGQGCLAEPTPEALAEGIHRVERVVDGDTLLLANRARVRMIGVDAPEMVRDDQPQEAWAAEAAAFTEEFLAGGEARLQLDRERLDQYGRFLAYVWVDDRLL